jgi:hypothetical protein
MIFEVPLAACASQHSRLDLFEQTSSIFLLPLIDPINAEGISISAGEYICNICIAYCSPNSLSMLIVTIYKLTTTCWKSLNTSDPPRYLQYVDKAWI